MTGRESVDSASERLLTALRGELASRGVRSSLETDRGQPRLGIHYPGGGVTADDLFDSVIVTRFRGEWWYGWPEVVPICAVAPVARAVQAVISELGSGDGRRPGEPGIAGVADLAARRERRQARQGIFR
jgi:hypothetical protein